jgi:hypothetical protein
MRKVLVAVFMLGAFSLTAAAGFAAGQDTPAPDQGKAVEAPGKGPMSEEDMTRMKEYTTPNENHQLLEHLAGNWTTAAKFWMDPKAEPETSNGTSSAKMIMGGRFLEQNFTGTAMGQPFEGRGLLGYDNLKKEFTSVWFDNMATGIMTGSGKYDDVAKTITSEGSMSCPITNETHRWYKDVTTWIDDDHYKYESYMKDKDGQEFKGMEITYTRQK